MPDYIEIVNGLTGVRVPKVYAPLSNTPKAPIQGVRFRDGSWSPPGTPLKFKNGNNEGGITRVDAMTVTVKEKGPIRAVVEVNYAITSPELSYGALKVRPAGPAHYTTTFTLERGQPSVLIETDTDLYSTFSLSLYGGVRPTQLRYCGSNASEPKYGRIEDGSKYPVVHSRPGMDAIVDLDYAQPVEVSYNTGDGTRGWMRLWDPWASNTGYYWHMYDAGGKPDSNLMGIFAGAPSRLIGAGGSGPGIYNRPGPDAGITIETNLRGGDNSLFLDTSKRTVRFAWGIYAGTRADAPDKLTDIPGIKKQWVLHGNGINLRKLIRWQLDYPDPNPPFGAMYMPRPAIEAMIQKLRTDEAYLPGLPEQRPLQPRPLRHVARHHRRQGPRHGRATAQGHERPGGRLGQRPWLHVHEVFQPALADPARQGGPLRPGAGQRLPHPGGKDAPESGHRALRQLALGRRPVSVPDRRQRPGVSGQGQHGQPQHGRAVDGRARHLHLVHRLASGHGPAPEGPRRSGGFGGAVHGAGQRLRRALRLPALRRHPHPHPQCGDAAPDAGLQRLGDRSEVPTLRANGI